MSIQILTEKVAQVSDLKEHRLYIGCTIPGTTVITSANLYALQEEAAIDAIIQSVCSPDRLALYRVMIRPGSSACLCTDSPAGLIAAWLWENANRLFDVRIADFFREFATSDGPNKGSQAHDLWHRLADFSMDESMTGRWLNGAFEIIGAHADAIQFPKSA